jgi:hypothetical protein
MRRTGRQAVRKRSLAILATIGLIGTLTLGTTSMAMADDAPVGDEGVTTTQVEVTSVQEETTPPVEDTSTDNTAATTPVQEAPAPSEDSNSDGGNAGDTPAVTDAPSNTNDAGTKDAVVTEQSVAPVQQSTVDTSTSSKKDKGGDNPYEAKKVFVCKYVGTPGTNERLQTGNNPISVSVNAIQNNQWDGTVPGWFSDAHDRSYVLAYNTGQPEPSVSECPEPQGPEEPPFSWDWQYAAPTCDGLTVAYPNNIPAGSNNKDVNIRVKDLVSGEVRTFNFHDSDFVTSGKTVTYKVTEHPSWPGWTYYEYQWTQVHGTNYHWEGSVTCGNPPVTEPEVVTGTATFTTASCEAPFNTAVADAVPGGEWVFTDKNNGTYVTAVGEGFSGDVPGGLAYGNITVELRQSQDGDTSAYEVTPWSGVWTTVDPATVSSNCTPPEPVCVDNADWSYTFDGVGSGTVTVTAEGAKQGDELCDALIIRATTYEYDRPASGNPSWPQTRVGYNDTVVDSIGTFSYAAPVLDTCRQHDIYAAFVSEGGYEVLTVPAKLYGPQNPFEPQFLHEALAGEGPNPTYSTTTSDGCNPPSEPEVVTGTGTFTTATCEAPSNTAELDAVPGGIWVFTDKNGDTFTTEMGEGYSDGIPEGLAFGPITVELKQSPDSDTDAYEVTPWSGVWSTVDPEGLECNTDEPEVVTGTAKFETLSCTEGSRNWVVAEPVPGAVWIFVDPTDAGNRFVTEIGEGYSGALPEGLPYGTTEVSLRDGDDTDNYEVTPWDGTWKTVDPKSLDCEVVVIPPKETPTPTPPVTNPPAPPSSNPPGGLAQTGADGSALLGTGLTAGLLMALGLALVMVRRHRRLGGQQ